MARYTTCSGATRRDRISSRARASSILVGIKPAWLVLVQPCAHTYRWRKSGKALLQGSSAPSIRHFRRAIHTPHSKFWKPLSAINFSTSHCSLTELAHRAISVLILSTNPSLRAPPPDIPPFYFPTPIPILAGPHSPANTVLVASNERPRRVI